MINDNINLANIPFNLIDLCNKLNDKKEPIHVRENYRIRLLDIKKFLDSNLIKFEIGNNFKRK